MAYNKWHLDGDNTTTSDYEITWRVATITQLFFYLPAATFSLFIFLIDEEAGNLTWFVTYYFMCYFTLAAPLIG